VRKPCYAHTNARAPHHISISSIHNRTPKRGGHPYKLYISKYRLDLLFCFTETSVLSPLRKQGLWFFQNAPILTKGKDVFLATHPSPTMTAAARTNTTTLEARLLPCRHMFFFLVLILSKSTFLWKSSSKFWKSFHTAIYGKGGGSRGSKPSLLQLRGQANGFGVCDRSWTRNTGGCLTSARRLTYP